MKQLISTMFKSLGLAFLGLAILSPADAGINDELKEISSKLAMAQAAGDLVSGIGNMLGGMGGGWKVYDESNHKRARNNGLQNLTSMLFNADGFALQEDSRERNGGSWERFSDFLDDLSDSIDNTRKAVRDYEALRKGRWNRLDNLVGRLGGDKYSRRNAREWGNTLDGIEDLDRAVKRNRRVDRATRRLADDIEDLNAGYRVQQDHARANLQDALEEEGEKQERAQQLMEETATQGGAEPHIKVTNSLIADGNHTNSQILAAEADQLELEVAREQREQAAQEMSTANARRSAVSRVNSTVK